jgi:hypothetical protein
MPTLEPKKIFLPTVTYFSCLSRQRTQEDHSGPPSRQNTNSVQGKKLMKLKDYAALAASSVFALTSFSSAFAHEVRILPTSHGNIQLVVGFHVEPAFEDSFNAVDVILSTTDGICPGSGSNLGQPIDVNGTAGAQNPDTVNLKVEALYLQKSVPPGGAPIGNIAPAGIITKLRITDSSPLNEAFGRPGVYNSYFRPTNPGDGTNGAYGFHIFGNVHAGPNSVTCPGSSTPHLLAARSLKIDTYFVCGVAGSLVPPDAFGCITPVQPFPGDAADGYDPSAPFLPSH